MKMPVTVFVALLISLSLCAPIAEARDDVYFLPIKDALELGKTKGKLDGSVQFYFSDQSHPAVDASLVQDIVTNKKTGTNTSNSKQTDEEACRWAMVSALMALQERARKEGGNAVINIESYYKKNNYKSQDQYECHAGSLMTGVALKGDVVRLGK